MLKQSAILSSWACLQEMSCSCMYSVARWSSSIILKLPLTWWKNEVRSTVIGLVFPFLNCAHHRRDNYPRCFTLMWYSQHNRMGWDLSLSFSAYGSIFQKHRRLFQQSFSQQKVIQYRRLQLREAHRLAINLLENAPDRMETLLSLWEIIGILILLLTCVLDSFSTSIIISITYGHEILSDDDPYVQLAAENRYVITHCGTPGGTPVDLFPICTLSSAIGHYQESSWITIQYSTCHRGSQGPSLHGKRGSPLISLDKCKLNRLIQSGGRWWGMRCHHDWTKLAAIDRGNSKTFLRLVPPWASASRI